MTETDDFALKRQLDALPRAIEPAHDLWPGIRARLPRHRTRRWHRGARLLRLAAGIGAIAMLSGILAGQRGRASAWYVTGELGMPTLDGRAIDRRERMVPGASVATDAGASATADVGTIGTIEIAAGTRVRLLDARATRHRLALDRGRIEVRISAPPRLFVVETPSGTAVDLGCAYRLEVDSAGNGRLVVTAGWVEYGAGRPLTLVPAGFGARAFAGRGVGLPLRDSADAALVAAAAAFDATPDTATAARVAAAATRSDAVTLWHLLARVDGAERERVYDRLAALVPPPASVTRVAALRLDPLALRLWWVELPGTLPIIPSWTQTLWTWWLRLVG